MANYVPLDFAVHRLLRLTNVHGAALGDDLGMVSVVASEIPALVSSYALFFRKSPLSGAFELGAVLGFASDENLFLAHGGWDAGYVPLAIRREPFAVQQSAASPNRNTLMVDLDSPRLSRELGDILFFSDGRPSERLQGVLDALEALVKGAELTRGYVAALEALDLIEPVEVRIDLGNGAAETLAGLFTIAEDRLATLSAEAVVDLHRQGFLPWIYQQVASAGQINALILRKIRQQGQNGG